MSKRIATGTRRGQSPTACESTREAGRAQEREGKMPQGDQAAVAAKRLKALADVPVPASADAAATRASKDRAAARASWMPRPS